MIIAVSIVDKHKPAGQGHVGTIHVEVPEIDAGASHYDLKAMVCELKSEEQLRRLGSTVNANLLDRQAIERLDKQIVREDYARTS